MNDLTSVLAQKSVMIIFTYAPAGLGHLRVTDALYHALPPGADPILLRSQDASTSYLHRLTSSHTATRAVMEWLQHGWPEEIFTRIYRRFIRSNTGALYRLMTTVLDERFDEPQTVLIVATHFGLAHQLAAIKERLEATRHIKIRLVLQVTDDSPQRIWYVAGADLIVVPSLTTKIALVTYGQKAGLPPVRFEVLPYPVNPKLNELLTAAEYDQRLRQAAAKEKAEIHVAIPVSGAAVGLTFSRLLIEALHQKSPRFRFHVVAKVSPYSQVFLHDLESCPYVTLHTGTTDRETVEQYEQLYQDTIVTFEVTKPSEQAFKALISPHSRGGVLLLFSQPVGRQEYDNLDFLGRHFLVPNADEQKQLWNLAAQQGCVDHELSPLVTQAITWRGVRLPADPLAAAEYIWWSLQQELFTRMLWYILMPPENDRNPRETLPDGSPEFWETVCQLLDANHEADEAGLPNARDEPDEPGVMSA